MNTEDFEFLRRKEFLILFFMLLSLTFAQISVAGISRIEPFVSLNFSFFETLGMILPIFAIIFIYFQKRSEKKMSLPPFILFLGVGVIACILIASFGASITPEEEPTESPDDNTTSTITSITQQTIESPHSQSPSPPDDGSKSLDFGFFFQFLMESKIFIAIAILFLPILLIIMIREKSRPEETDLEITDEIPADRQEKPYRLRTILECYYQASTALEERGADSSPSFTPTEFTTDVVAKDLTSTLLINDLTSLFEEVKFSTHDFSDQEVNSAKSLSSKIIFSSDSPAKNETEKEPEEIE